MLVLMGATEVGTKERIAIQEGFRESEESRLTQGVFDEGVQAVPVGGEDLAETQGQQVAAGGDSRSSVCGRCEKYRRLSRGCHPLHLTIAPGSAHHGQRDPACLRNRTRGRRRLQSQLGHPIRRVAAQME